MEFNHPVKEYDYIYSIFNRMNPLFTLGEEFRFHHSSRFRKKAKMRKMLFLTFLDFQFQSRCFEVLVFNFNRIDKAFEFFGLGMLYYYKKDLSTGDHQGRP